MLKKILSLTLCLCICLGVVISATSCGSESEKTSNSSSTDAAPTTLSFLGVTSEVTSQDAIEKVETALNDIFSARYKTKIDLTLVTENEYMKLIEERVEQAKYWQKYDESIAQYNAFIKNQANQTGTSTDKIFGNWIANDVAISLETLATRLIYVAEQTTVYEDGRVETLYPEATPIDIVMILDEEMYDEFSNMGLLLENGIDPNFSSYKTLQKYIYPTFFSELKNLKGVINAIPNNNLLAESTYLVVNKDVADAANFNIETFKNYADLADVLATAKSQGKLAPFKEVPEALGVFKLFSEDVAIGAYFDPMVGYNPDEGDEYAEYEIKNLFEIPQYVEHLELMETYTKAGYFSKANMANGYAVQVITGDASVYEKYSAKDSKYYVKEIQIPFVLREAIFDGMLAPTSYTESPERAMEIIAAINTDPAVKNLLQYGIYEENYVENEADGTVIRLNTEYMMENAYTGNVYMGLLEADMGETSWAYVKQTNLASTNSPFLLFSVDENYLKSNLKKILQDAALAEVLADMGLSFDAYRNASGSTLVSYNGMLKNAHKDFFINKTAC
jgi:putative aldouronate transport system substrate-binding protein